MKEPELEISLDELDEDIRVRIMGKSRGVESRKVEAILLYKILQKLEEIQCQGIDIEEAILKDKKL